MERKESFSMSNVQSAGRKEALFIEILLKIFLHNVIIGHEKHRKNEKT